MKLYKRLTQLSTQRILVYQGAVALMLLVHPVSAEYTLVRQSVNHGGVNNAAAGPYSHGASTGQTSPGSSGGADFLLQSGFWYIEPPQSVRLALPDVAACPANIVGLEVIVDDFQQVAGINMRIEYDPSIIVVNLGDTIASNYISNPYLGVGPEGDRLSIVWFDNINPLTLTNGDTLLTIYFQLVGSVNDTGIISWDDSYTALFTPTGDILGPLVTVDGSILIVDCVLRGDVDHNGAIDISDLTCYVEYLFGEGCLMPCPVEADCDANGTSDISDLTYLVDYLFGGGPPPPDC